MFMTVDTSNVDSSTKPTRLYILEMWVDGKDTPIYKVGKASGSSSKKRMISIVESYFDKYRETPRVKIVMDREVDDVFSKETEIHRILKEYGYNPSKKFSGSTELFEVSKEKVVEVYEQVTGISKKTSKMRKCVRCKEEKEPVHYKGRGKICRSCRECS